MKKYLRVRYVRGSTEKSTDDIAAMQAVYGNLFAHQNAIASIPKAPWTSKSFRVKRLPMRQVRPTDNWDYVKLPNNKQYHYENTKFGFGGIILAPTRKWVIDKKSVRAFKEFEKIMRAQGTYLPLEEEPRFTVERKIKKPKRWKVKDCKFYKVGDFK